MKITRKKGKPTTLFQDVLSGDVFEYNGEFYLKLRNSGDVLNAAVLGSSFGLRTISGIREVLVHPNAELVINETE